MKRFNVAFVFIMLTLCAYSQGPATPENRLPLHQSQFMEMPLGTITPHGWLREMLIRQKNGATGQLDKLYPAVMGKRNGWLGGDGDQWERGPYWIDGLLPLAYILHDKALIAKVKPWIEWTINSQTPDGYFGPSRDYTPEAGIQRDNSRDWWPKMVMLKVLKQYYSATGDPRVIKLLTGYFRYQLKELPSKPLDHWTFWAKYRVADNLMVVYWLYNITGDKFLLDLGHLLHEQSFDFTDEFLNTDLLQRKGSIHGVNLAEGMKEPIIYYQQDPDQKYLDAFSKGLSDLNKFDGLASGMYAADEALHGNDPTQGVELCSVVEMMFTLENALSITGGVRYADQLEKIAFNALPSQTTPDYMARQYFQQANQVMLTRHVRNFDVNHSGTDVCYGLLTGYPCCTSNMHQGWPKFTQNLFYATADKGVAALVYAPSEVTAKVADGIQYNIKEQTYYPFDESIEFTFTTKNKGATAFPFYLRIPSWCQKAIITVNGKQLKEVTGGQITTLTRSWKNNDKVVLRLPMHIFKNKWHENAVSVERGPIVYALKIKDSLKEVQNTKDPLIYGDKYLEAYAVSPWNYGLVNIDDTALDSLYRVSKKSTKPVYPWTLSNAPIELTVPARQIPHWKLYNDMAGPLPYSISYNEGMPAQKTQEVTLIPYGCTILRISEFPELNK